jgi:hypothetical protein
MVMIAYPYYVCCPNPISSGLSSLPTGQVEVLSNGWDEQLGGNPFDVRLTSYLADQFQVRSVIRNVICDFDDCVSETS